MMLFALSFQALKWYSTYLKVIRSLKWCTPSSNAMKWEDWSTCKHQLHHDVVDE